MFIEEREIQYLKEDKPPQTYELSAILVNSK